MPKNKEVIAVGDLTVKQRRFAEEYMLDFNATQAALRAGYSKRTARKQGSELLAKPAIQKRIRELTARADAQRTAQPEEVLEFLTAVMRGDMEETHIVTNLTGISQVGYVDQRNQLKAAELLAKCHGLMTQNLNVGADVAVTIVDDLQPDEPPDG